MEESNTIRSPITQAFHRRLATVMTLLHLGNRTWWGYDAPNRFVMIHRKVVVIFAPVCLMSETLYLILNYNKLSYSVLRTIILILPLDYIITVCIRSAQMDSFEKIMKLFMNKIHLYYYDDCDGLAKKKAITADMYTRITTYFMLLGFISGDSLWHGAPIFHLEQNINEIRNETVMLQTVLHLWLPYDYKYNIRNWAITHALNIYLISVGSTVFLIYNTLNYTLVFHLIGHVQILKHRFRTEFSTPLSDSDTKNKLMGLIKHHSFIIEIFKDTQKAFGYNVTANYCHNLLCDSLFMYEIMYGGKKDSILCCVMLLVFMGGIILMSLVLEEIRRESDDLPDVIYNIPWETMSISNQKTVMMILARAQTPMEFVSAGGLKAGVRPAISIIKSTFSYYVMLKSTMNVDT